MNSDIGKYLTELNQRIRKGCTAHITSDGRLYYMNHKTKLSSWLPPIESWDSGGSGLPYGWEAAIDKEGKTYFINHVNRTTTYEDPRKDVEDEPPLPRDVELTRDPQMGFGFVAGSEKPVIVRFVTEGGPSENKLLPGDQILKINGEDVMKSPREHVIELVRSCKHSVQLTVCQPYANNSTRKSALLTAAKKAKLKSNPSRVRFAEGVVINGSPLYSPSPLDPCIPVIPNVLKVFLENGQTKSFKYDSTTTVQDVLISLQEKLSTKCSDHFSLVVEHIKASRRNKLSLLDPKDTLAKIAARPGAHHLRCLFRVTFVPKDAYDLLQKDPGAFEYLYLQCCNDVVQERFAPELKYDVALRLSALHIQQHALSSGFQGKLTIKAIERECGLDRFVPYSLLETMKRKELRKLLSHFLKQNQSLCAPGQKQLTALQAKLHYLKIISDLPSYGAKCFSTSLKDSSPDTALLISPKYGISQITYLKNIMPITLAEIEEMSSIQVTKEDEMSYCVEIFMKDPDKESLCFSLEDKEVDELILMLKGYYRLLMQRELSVEREVEDPWRTEAVPCYHSRHTVTTSPWSYPPLSEQSLHTVDLTIPPPPYMSCEQQERQLSRNNSRDQCIITSGSVDHNMNETQIISRPAPNDTPILQAKKSHESLSGKGSKQTDLSRLADQKDQIGSEIDYRSVVSLEILEDTNDDIDLDLFEAKNDEVIRRISEMNKIVNDAEIYLSDDKDEMRNTEEQESERREEIENVEVQSQLKAADSLLLLTQIDDDSLQTGVNITEVRNMVENTEVSPSESDAESTSNDSPLHHSTPLRNSVESQARSRRRGSSFGLHSPDMFPGIDACNQNFLDMLRQLQSCSDLQLPFAEGTLYLDPDIIDLTMIPPPITPDSYLDVPSHLDHPPSLYLDANTLKEKLDSLAKAGLLNNYVGRDDVFDQLDPLPESNDVTPVAEEEKTCPAVDSARVVAELDHLCDTLSEMQANSLAETTNLVPRIPSSVVTDNISVSPHATPVLLDTVSAITLHNTDDIDSFIASVTVPPPPVDSTGESSAYSDSHDDISAYIIPPPPCSSHCTEVQNVLARFRQASDEIRKVIGTTDRTACNNGHCCGEGVKSDDDSRENPRDITQFFVGSQDNWTREMILSDKISPFGNVMPVLNPDYLTNEPTNTVSDSENHGGDSSGYNTLTSSLTSYGETVLQDDIEKCLHDFDSELNNYINVDLPCLNNTESSSCLPDKTSLQNISPTGVLKQNWKVPPTCTDELLEPLGQGSKLVSNAITKSDFLEFTSIEDIKPQIPPRTKKLNNYNSTDVSKTSLDDIKIATQSQHPLVITRSMSWTSISDQQAQSNLHTDYQNGHMGILKPPLPPSSPLLQSRFRRSLTKGIRGSSGGLRKVTESSSHSARIISAKHSHQRNSPGSSPSSSPSRSPRLTRNYQRMSTGKLSTAKVSHKLINGISNNSLRFSKPLDGRTFLKEELESCVDNKSPESIRMKHNGCILDDTDNNSETNISLLTEDLEIDTTKDGNSNDSAEKVWHDESIEAGPFKQVHSEISTMLLHLVNLKQCVNHHSETDIDIDKFVVAKDALIAESRQFVTASKLFVKSAMESSDGLIENMMSCVALMDRIFTVSGLVLSNMASTVQMSALMERLKGVALAYSQTVLATQQAMGKGISNPQMGTLMHQATTLATALTSLMRTLRSLTAV